MQFSVSDFLATYDSSVRLIAGQGGLARTVNEVGILDYELVEGLPPRYQRNNFYEGQLVLSSLLYARDNPYLLIDAIKHLVSVGASGLAIKNVFRLEIPDAALRYATARNFPLMLVTADDLYFDEVIIDVGLRVRELADQSFVQREVDELLQERDDPAASRAHARKLNPSLREAHCVWYATARDELLPEDFARMEGRYRESDLCLPRNLLCAYEQGMLLVVSDDVMDRGRLERTLAAAQELWQGMGPIGASEVHQDLGELGLAVMEALQASRLASMRAQDVVRYEGLGVLRAVLPHAESPAMRAFAARTLGPLRDFDAENNARLEQTLDAYLRCHRSVGETAALLETHPNTVRYRLGQVQGLTGLDWRQPEDMEQLSLAMTIELARKVC